MAHVQPDTSVFKEFESQPEFTEETWQYINRRVSDWRIINGKAALKKNEALFARIEKDFGVERGTLLALWGVESAFGDPLVQQNHMRPIFPSLAALAWNAPRRKPYWESELINALHIVDRGWGTPEVMRGSWAGAMGHTQWMPEVWLHLGIDYDGDGKVSPFGRPDDALARPRNICSTAANIMRANIGATRSALPRREGQPKVCGVDSRWHGPRRRPAIPAAECIGAALDSRAGRAGFPARTEFLCGAELQPVDELCAAICHLGDRILGAPPFIQPFPGSERALTLAEIQEMQTRLTKAGFDTGGTDGRVGNDTMKAVHDYQLKMGIEPADGYGGLKVLARLRQGS